MKMIRICAWCKRPIGFSSRILRFFGVEKQISHGICWKCKKEQLQRLETIVKEEKSVNQTAQEEVS